ncbi:uncharacterized membrane protein YobD (UPF0266 family) [Nicoletella semolina]|uniref:UPF0266 membrane protein YobD n=1 Tax=Nicoletella semolina TaxID=271160 RepID=A0A4R2ND44_9PAST|nr:DUF986 family protein [Nicoletella semolina]MDH2924120.1 hypothetical protein [Nicoletella semolina]TCP18984.1 uncharacterized membrane protein YobD (UPF0266 family) [Nicoletella semolina]
MINTLLLVAILLTFSYIFYEQFIIIRLKGNVKLNILLQRQSSFEAVIIIGLIIILIYQGFIHHSLSAFSIFLFSISILLTVYIAFIRKPRLILKERGFFIHNLYVEYDKIAQLNLSHTQNKKKLTEHLFVIDLKNGKRLVANIPNLQDAEQVVAFFGGYKSSNHSIRK